MSLEERKTKKAPQSGGYCGAKGFGLFLGGKDEKLCSVGINPTIVVRYVNGKIRLSLSL
jgi:hypothetical protein